MTMVAETLLTDVHFTVPLLPPSVNHAKFANFHKKPEARAFIDAVCIFSRKPVCRGPFYTVAFVYFIPKAQFLRWDVDNFLKITCDALKAAGIINDDRYILRVTAEKRVEHDSPDGRTCCHIQSSERPD